MRLSAHSIRRTWLVALTLVLLACFIGIQTAAQIEVHDHSHGSAHKHCCPACGVTHLPALQASAAFEIPSPDGGDWRRPASVVTLSGERLIGFHASRAPPV